MEEKNPAIGNGKTLPSCCEAKDIDGKKPSGLVEGIIYGLIPHTGCIAFIAFAILGATTMSALFQPLLMNRNLFYGLIMLSFAFATLSAAIYLNKRGLLSLQGISKAKGYLSILYGTTIGVNLLFFFVIFPMLVNAIPIGAQTSADLSASSSCPINSNESGCSNSPQAAVSPQEFAPLQQPILFSSSAMLKIQVDIPCSGHAPLIKQELSKIAGITKIDFVGSNEFDITYDPSKVAKADILNIAIFKTYPAREI
ncbi:MAG: hypothetical protein NTY68_00555 [Candidatus Micrarchaeota archaeon]|nr:hypothetical protein [Candidatus Micrarchaeota archaeon]